MELKPGMKVKVEYETTIGEGVVSQLDNKAVTLVYTPGRAVNRDGTPYYESQATHKFKVTPLPTMYEVKARVIVDPTASEGWLNEIQQRVDNALDKLPHQGLVVNVKKVDD